MIQNSGKQLIETEYYTGLYAKMIDRLLNKHEKIQFCYFSNISTDGLMFARKGAIALSGFYFSKIDSCISSLADGMLFKVSNTVYLPAKSYYFYKQGQTTNAEQLLSDAIVNDIHFVRLGFPVMGFHLIQQYHNLIRIYLRYQRYSEALGICSSIMCFLLSGEVDSEGLLNELRPIYQTDEYYFSRHAMLSQIIYETAICFIKQIKGKEIIYKMMYQLLLPIFNNLEYYEIVNDDDLAMIKWIKIIELFFLGCDADFQAAAKIFLSGHAIMNTSQSNILAFFLELSLT